MTRWEESISVNASADKVFAYVSDFTLHGEWAGHGLSCSQDTDGPVQVGTTFSTLAKQFGTQREKSTVTELDPPRTFGWTSEGALGRIRHWFTIRDDGGSTTLSKGAEVTGPTLLGKMFTLKLRKGMPSSLRRDLAGIKQNLEGSAG